MTECCASTCPHCHFPAVLPEICTPEINAAIERGIARAAGLYQAGREAASPLPLSGKENA